MMSMFEVYKAKANAVYPKLEYRDECLRILKEAEKTDKEWIEVGEKAPTEDMMINILIGRTQLKNPLWKKTLAKGLGYESVKEMMGDEDN